MRILVLGGGRMGAIVAADLARSFDVTVADSRGVAVPGARSMRADLSGGLDRLLSRFDLAVSALPSRLGLSAARAAVEARRTLVDLAFAAQDPFALEPAARRAGIALVPDCGLSPGISNLWVGSARGRPRRVRIHVGGVASDPAEDYVATWSLEDLLEEYVRPARIVVGGRRRSVPALSGLETVRVPGVGTMEAFFSDGLRTLLRTTPAREMAEKTLRWPGHAARMIALREMGAFRRPETLTALWRALWERPRPRDTVVLDVRVDRRRWTLVERARGGLTAMARTTALTCAVFARLAAAGGLPGTGVLPPELIGADPRAYEFVRRELARRGIRWSER